MMKVSKNNCQSNKNLIDFFKREVIKEGFVINPYEESYSEEQNNKRYRILLAKLICSGCDIFCFVDKKNGLFIKNEEDCFLDKIEKIIYDMKIKSFNKINDKNIDNFILMSGNIPHKPVNGMGYWSLNIVAKSNI